MSALLTRIYTNVFTNTAFQGLDPRKRKHPRNDNKVNIIADLTSNFSALKKCNGKLISLIYEMFSAGRRNLNRISYAQNYLFKIDIFN